MLPYRRPTADQHGLQPAGDHRVAGRHVDGERLVPGIEVRSTERLPSFWRTRARGHSDLGEDMM
jgi:hypothetical protein